MKNSEILSLNIRDTRSKKNDFCFAPEGEPVRFGSQCGGELIDGPCGCKRSLVGMKSHKATSTMKVAQLDQTEDEMMAKLALSLEDSGYSSIEEDLRAEVREVVEVANQFPLGTVIERRGSRFIARRRKTQ